MQCSKAIFLSVAYPALQYFSTYFMSGTIFEKKNVMGHKMCVLIFSTTFAKNILHCKKN